MSEGVENCPFCGKEPASGLTFIPAAKWAGLKKGKHDDGVRCGNEACILFNKIFTPEMWNKRARTGTGDAEYRAMCRGLIAEFLGRSDTDGRPLDALINDLGISRDCMMEALHWRGGGKTEGLETTLRRLAIFLRDRLGESDWARILDRQSSIISKALFGAPGEICSSTRFDVLSGRLRDEIAEGRYQDLNLLLQGIRIELNGESFHSTQVRFVAEKLAT